MTDTSPEAIASLVKDLRRYMDYATCQEAADMIKALQQELSQVDEALARRAALDGCENRVDKILKAITTAGRAERGLAEMEALAREAALKLAAYAAEFPEHDQCDFRVWEALQLLQSLDRHDVRRFKVGDHVRVLAGPECYSDGIIVMCWESCATVRIERNPGVPEHDCEISVLYAQVKLMESEDG